MARKHISKNTRKHKRLRALYLVKYQVGGAGDAPRLTNIKDVSAGGMKFLAREFLPEAASLKISLLIPNLGWPLEAKAKVLRSRRTKHGFVYSVAVEFTEISKEDRSALTAFIEDMAKDEKGSLMIDHADVVVRSGPPSGGS